MKKKEIVNNTNNELSYDTKTIIVILTLIFVYPIGVVLMLVWMDWNKWFKILLSVPLVLGCLVPILLLILIGTMVFKIGDNLTRPEMVREIRQIIEVVPTEMSSKLDQKMISPTIRVIKK